MYSCILYEFYIKPQLTIIAKISIISCILYEFYIKPQLVLLLVMLSFRCILYEFYIKPQRLPNNPKKNNSCILYEFYIKPQPGGLKRTVCGAFTPFLQYKKTISFFPRSRFNAVFSCFKEQIY